MVLGARNSILLIEEAIAHPELNLHDKCEGAGVGYVTSGFVLRFAGVVTRRVIC